MVLSRRRMPRRPALLARLLLVCATTVPACSDAPDPTGLPEPLGKHQASAPGPVVAAAPVIVPSLLETCDQLAAAAATRLEDATVLLELCPEAATTPAILRNALLMVDSPAAAAALLPRLASAPDLAGLARLAAIERTSTPAPRELPDPVSATVSPITDTVLAEIQLAIVQQTASGVSQDQRTRATAYLARVHHEALQQLGLDNLRGNLGDPSLPPFARLLTGRFLHFGRELCRMYWQRRVAGLEALFASTEVALLHAVLALERTPHLADDALLAVEHQRTRRHLQGSGVAERLTRAGAVATPADLLPLLHEFDRLVDHRFVELTLQRALFLAGDPPGAFGLAPVAEWLRAQLADRDLYEYAALLERRIDESRALSPPPPEQGARPLPTRVALTWPTDLDAAAQASAWLDIAVLHDGLTRKHALARAALLLRERPDAAQALLRRELAAIDPAPGRSLRLGLVQDLLVRLDDESLAVLRLRVAAAARPLTGDDAVRRAFALAARDARLLPR